MKVTSRGEKGSATAFRGLLLFAQMSRRFGRNRARQSDDEDLGRHFCYGADHHRIRDLFGCRVDER